MKVNAILTILILTLPAGNALAVRSSVSRGTVPPSDYSTGRGTVPPTTYRSGLRQSPNPIDTSSNLPITGNVTGLDYFHGSLPYRAPSEFGAHLGSAELDSFLRTSAGISHSANYTGKYEPYYSHSGTVARLSPGQSAVVRPPSSRIDFSVNESYDTGKIPASEQSRWYSDEEQERVIAEYGLRPLGLDLEQFKKSVSGTIAIDEQRLLTDEKYQAQLSKFRQDLKIAGNKVEQLKQDLIKPQQMVEKVPEPGIESLEQEKLQGKKETQDQTKQDELQQQLTEGRQDKYLQVYDLMKWQVGDVDKFIKQEMPQTTETNEGAADTGVKDEQKQTAKQTPLLMEKYSDEKYAQQARIIMGPHKTFASFINDRFNKYMWAAETYLKQGKYYYAADTYSLAAIVKPDDPLPHAGKAHAFFAAGEYMSSALSLARAIDIFSGYAKVKIDLVAIFGDKDIIENRIIEIEKIIGINNAPQLHFLLGYICYQMDRRMKAEEHLEAAYKKAPDWPALIALRKAVSGK